MNKNSSCSSSLTNFGDIKCDLDPKFHISKIKFNLVTKEVHDQQGNLLGYGVLQNGVVVIEKVKRQ